MPRGTTAVMRSFAQNVSTYLPESLRIHPLRLSHNSPTPPSHPLKRGNPDWEPAQARHEEARFDDAQRSQAYLRIGR